MPDREALEPSAELIVIGASVRALAASARAAGWSVRAADLFRDRWTTTEIATLADLLGRLTAGQPGDLS